MKLYASLQVHHALKRIRIKVPGNIEDLGIEMAKNVWKIKTEISDYL